MNNEEKPSLSHRLKTLVIGEARNPQDPRVFHKLALIAFFAWIGLGADGLSSSCYGPAEAFIVLQGHPYLAIFVALGTGFTVFIISSAYSQIIELFPAGGGGYLVASKLLSPTFGMISGCALLVDYMLTISLSIASGAEAIFSFLPVAWYPYRLEFAIFGVIVLIILNLRGVKESVMTLMPIFMIFVLTHLFAILYSLFSHVGNIPVIAQNTIADINSVSSEIGVFGLIMLLLRAYSMGAGTYTGIEAVSNGLPILREPKVLTGKRTMHYMAISLAFTVIGLMLAYILFNVSPQTGKTLNAVLFENITANWNGGLGYAFVLVTLISEAAILFVASQTGFIDGPRVLANMAMDRWFPSKFANLSDRLVTQNGVLLMGGAALILIMLTGGSVQFLLVLYSINVFITFVLSQAGMVRHWWQARATHDKWRRGLFVNGLGLILTTSILISVSVVKFHEGGWITILVTGSLVLIVTAIKRHYNSTFVTLKRLDNLVVATESSSPRSIPDIKQDLPPDKQYDPKAMTAVLMVNGFNGLGLHALFSIIRTFKGVFKNFVFVQVGVIDAGVFKGSSEIEKLQTHISVELDRYVEFTKRHGYYSEGISSTGIDVVDEIEQLGPKILERFPQAIFFGGQIVFKEDTFLTRWLHNYVVFAVQRRFYHKGLPFIILPIRA